MDTIDNKSVKLADAKEANVSDVIRLAVKARQRLECEIEELNKALDAKRAELQELNEVVNFKSIDHRR
jgi:hypothetical protein